MEYAQGYRDEGPARHDRPFARQDAGSGRAQDRPAAVEAADTRGEVPGSSCVQCRGRSSSYERADGDADDKVDDGLGDGHRGQATGQQRSRLYQGTSGRVATMRTRRSSAEINLAVPVAGSAVAGLRMAVTRGGGLDPAGAAPATGYAHPVAAKANTIRAAKTGRITRPCGTRPHRQHPLSLASVRRPTVPGIQRWRARHSRRWSHQGDIGAGYRRPARSTTIVSSVSEPQPNSSQMYTTAVMVAWPPANLPLSGRTSMLQEWRVSSHAPSRYAKPRRVKRPACWVSKEV